MKALIRISTLAVTLVAASAASAESYYINAADYGVTEFNFTALGGENVEDQNRRQECLGVRLEKVLGVPVNMRTAADYAGVLEGFLGGTVDMSELGASGYARVFLTDPNAVEPLAVTKQMDGSTGYYSEILVRADSGIDSFADLEGRSFYFGDPDSTSGTLVPTVSFRMMGIDPEEYFSEVGFSGGHEQSIVGVFNGDFDASGTWISGQGNFEDGYTRGGLRRTLDNGLIDISELKPIWRSDEIPEGPLTVRQALPTEVKEAVRTSFLNFAEEDPDCMAIYGNEISGYARVDHSNYEFIVEMRRGAFGG